MKAPDQATTRNKFEPIARRTAELVLPYHYSCEDCWYSCPQSIEGCCNDAEGDECNCGLEKQRNEATKAILDAIFQAAVLAQHPEIKVDLNG